MIPGLEQIFGFGLACAIFIGLFAWWSIVPITGLVLLWIFDK